MARQLIASLESTWDPARYTDEYKENLMRIIRARSKGKAPKLVAEDHAPKQAEVVDLMARLRASLEGKDTKDTKDTKERGSGSRRAASKPRKSARTRKRVA